MAYDKLCDSAVLDAGLKQIADAIREKGGTSDNLAFPTAMAEAIAAIQAGGSGDDTVNILNDVITREITSFTCNASGIGVAAFKNCYDLLYAKFPEATYVYDEAFYDCQRLKTLDLPKATKLVGECLYHTGYIEALILRSTTVCTLSNINAFSRSAIKSGGTGYIYVPSALVESYKVATNWSTLETQFRALEHYTVDGTITGELDENKI